MRLIRTLISFVSCCIFYCSCGDHPDGASHVTRSQDALGNYHFSYKVANSEGEQFREEGTDTLGRVIGSYGLKHVDGTHRVVDYIADKDGFRAAVRSNEPGLVSAESADASILKTDHNAPLSVAETSDDQSRQVFGKRLDTDASRVSYANEDEVKSTDDEAIRESRQYNFDDYRPLSPVAYYPTGTRNPSNPSVSRPVDPNRVPRVLTQNFESNSKPLDVYVPPLNPYTAARRPTNGLPRERSPGRNIFPATTSQKPYIPPYGGFDDDDPIPPVGRHPGVAVHSGLGPNYHLSTPTPVSSYGGRKFPSSVPQEHRSFDLPHSPHNFRHPSSQNSGLPSPPRDIPQDGLFNPPSYDDGLAFPNFVLRAVPIPNGIQAVRVDPTTGRVYERLVYPLFLRHDGQPEYDRNILLHNDEFSDDDMIPRDDPNYLDMPYLRRPFRRVRNQQPTSDDENRFINRHFNRSYKIDENSLSQPSASDVDWVKRQLASVEGFNREQLFDGLSLNRLPDHDSNLPGGDSFDNGIQYRSEGRISDPRIRSNPELLNYSSEEDIRRGRREDLVHESSEKVLSKLTEKVAN